MPRAIRAISFCLIFFLCVGLSPCWRPHCNFLDRANGRGGSGSQAAADPPSDLRRTLKSRLWDTNPASTFKLSQCWHCKVRLPGPRRALGSPPAICSPERPRPFTRYRNLWGFSGQGSLLLFFFPLFVWRGRPQVGL